MCPVPLVCLGTTPMGNLNLFLIFMIEIVNDSFSNESKHIGISHSNEFHGLSIDLMVFRCTLEGIRVVDG